jgi:hypothetical protein
VDLVRRVSITHYVWRLSKKYLVLAYKGFRKITVMKKHTHNPQAAYGFVAGTSNALIDGKNIGDALGGGAATATFGASIGTMMDDRTGSGTYTVGLNRKQVAVVHLVDFGDEPRTDHRLLQVNIYSPYKDSPIGSIAIDIAFDIDSKDRLIKLSSNEPPYVYQKLDGLDFELSSVNVVQTRNKLYYTPDNITLDIRFVFTGSSESVGSEHGFSLSAGGDKVGGSYNFNYTSSRVYNGNSHLVGGTVSFNKATGNFNALHSYQGWDEYVALRSSFWGNSTYMFKANVTQFFTYNPRNIIPR